MLEVIDPKRTKFFQAIPLKGEGRKLAVNEETFISAFVDPSYQRNLVKLAEEHGVLGQNLVFEVTFPDGRKAGVRLRAM